MTTVAVLGATSGIAHATLRQWAARGDDLRLVARDAERLARVEGDLTARGAGAVVPLLHDLGTVEAVEAAVDALFADAHLAHDVVYTAEGGAPMRAEAALPPRKNGGHAHRDVGPLGRGVLPGRLRPASFAHSGQHAVKCRR